MCISVWPISIDSHFPKRAKRIFYPRPAPRGMRYDTSARRDLTTMNIREKNPPAGLELIRPPEGNPATGPAGECESLTPLHKSRSRAGSGHNWAVSGTATIGRFRVRPCQLAETALRLARHRAPQFDGESVAGCSNVLSLAVCPACGDRRRSNPERGNRHRRRGDQVDSAGDGYGGRTTCRVVAYWPVRRDRTGSSSCRSVEIFL